MSIPRILPHQPPPLATWPHSRARFELQASQATLLVHDLQQYFLDHFDRTQEPIVSLLRNVQQLLELCRHANVPVLYTCQPPEQPEAQRGLLTAMWGKGIGAAPHRAGIEPCVAPQPADHTITKWRYSAFQRTPLLGHLQHVNRKQLIVCGVYAHIGCLATAMEAFMHDIEVFFVADAVADFSQQQHLQALECVASCCGQVLSTHEAIRAIGGTALERWQHAAAPAPSPQLGQ